jgi:hypothetical protein
MNTNLVADTINTTLSGIHARVYRNQAPASPTFPYVVFNLDSVSDTFPSYEYYCTIRIFDSPSVSVRAMETLADNIYKALDDKVFRATGINMHMKPINRQFVSNDELTTSKMIAIQFDTRVYF